MDSLDGAIDVFPAEAFRGRSKNRHFIRAGGERRFKTAQIGRQSGIDYARRAADRAKNLRIVRQLRDFAWGDERTRLDKTAARLGQLFDQFDLDAGRDFPGLVLQAVARADLDDLYPSRGGPYWRRLASCFFRRFEFQQFGAFRDLIADREKKRRTAPSLGAAMRCSIFIASRIISGAPFSTRAPASVSKAMTRPGMVAVRPPWLAASARRVSSGSTWGLRPMSPAQKSAEQAPVAMAVTRCTTPSRSSSNRPIGLAARLGDGNPASRQGQVEMFSAIGDGDFNSMAPLLEDQNARIGQIEAPAVARIPRRAEVVSRRRVGALQIGLRHQHGERGDEKHLVLGGACSSGNRKALSRSIKPVSSSALTKAGQAKRRERNSTLVAQADDLEFRQRQPHPQQGLFAVFVMDNQFGDHRIIIGADAIALVGPASTRTNPLCSGMRKWRKIPADGMNSRAGSSA